MKKLNEAALLIGDIVLTTTNQKVSKGIRAVTKSDVSHAMVYVEAYSVADSTGEGVHARNTQRLMWDESNTVHVLRLARSLTANEAQIVVDFVRSRVGTEYTVREALGSVSKRRGRGSKKQFCSRLVAQAYAEAKIHLAHNPDYCSPADLKNSPLLVAVSNALVVVTDEYAEAVSRLPDMTQAMRDSINQILQGARTRDSLIQDLNDVDAHLIAHPEDDSFIADLVTRSGYLKIWILMRDQHPWQCDLKLLKTSAMPMSEKRQYCETTIGDREEGIRRYHENYAGYKILCERHGLKTFQLLQRLYMELVEFQQLRRRTAIDWLKQHSPASLAALGPETVLLTPHTPEWFSALTSWNPSQAAQTRQILELAGKLDVCSICGDEPATDYRLIGPTVPDGCVHTIRLCDDCWNIQRGMYRNSFALT